MPAKRKDDTNDDAESINSNGSSSIKNSKRLRASTSNLKQTSTSTSQIGDLAQELYDYLKSYRNSENRVISDTFAKLPAKRGNADYYSTIKDPIDFIKIQHKIKSDEYKTFNDFDSDVQLIITNAKAFYKKNSFEYKDAVGLHEAFEAEKKKKSLAISKIGAKVKVEELEQDEEENEEEEVDDEEEDGDDEEEEEDEENDEAEDEEEEEKMEIDDSAQTEVKGRGRRARASSAKSSPVKGVKNEKLNNSNDLDDTERSTRLKSTPKHDLSVYLEDFFDIICSFQDQTQRYLAIVFYLLPSAKVYPDYYEIIKKPIDLKMIAKKILKSEYKNLKQMETDLAQMTDNAKRYNDPKSIIYKDAAKLKKLARDSCNELNNLMQHGKLYQSNKTREKKQKLVQEISEFGEEEFNQLLQNQAKIPIKAEQIATVVAKETDDDEDDEEDLDQTNSDNEAATGKTSGRKTSALLSLMWNLFDYVKEYKNGAQTLIDPFLKLPSKRIYPDYYEEIKKPIAMNMIKKSLSKRLYKSIKELGDDLELMCKNAMQYNVEESIIYMNAKKLLEAIRQKTGELQVLAASLPPETIVPKSPANTPKKVAAGTASINKSGVKQTKANIVEHNIKRLFKLLLEYCGGEEDASGKQSGSNQTIPGGRANSKVMLSQHFMSLPSRDQQPDYYEKIKDPLDFNTVQKRIDSSHYATEGDMVVDCIKVLENAKSYYSESTQYHKDAQKLKQYLNKKYQLFLNRQNLNVNEELEGSFITASGSVPLPKFNDLKDKLLYLYNYINDYQIDQRELAYPFRHLPSKTEYPDYYNIIKKPIDMAKIMHKINQLGHATNSYSGIDDMCIDFGQMFENACIYNEPTSTLYKDALNLQRALFLKRDEMVNYELSLTSPSYENFNETLHESLPSDFVSRAVHELIETLYDSCIQYQDLEGRVLSESFVDLYDLFDKTTKDMDQQSLLNIKPIVTFDMVHKRLKDRVYKRIDVFQEEMFEVFNQIRTMSYFEVLTNIDTSVSKYNKYKINRYSQLYKDAYELQRYFIQKRDEICRNGDLLLTGALSYKLSSLDSHVTHVINTTALSNSSGSIALPITNTYNVCSFDEYEALLVDQRYKVLESSLGELLTKTEDVQFSPGSFYYADRKLITSNLIHKEMFNINSNNKEQLIVCILASNQSNSKLIVQVYLKPSDDEFIDYEFKRTKKFFNKEVVKTDLYALIDMSDDSIKSQFKPCVVIGVKEFIASEPAIKEDSMANLTKDDIFICESMYSTYFKYFRKLMSKKWSPLSFISGAQTPTNELVTLNKRQMPILLTREYINEPDMNYLISAMNAKLDMIVSVKPVFKSFYRETIQYDSPPAAASAAAAAKEKDADEIDTTTSVIEEDPELMKTAKYYEQLLYKNSEWYKLGDYVYVKYQANSSNTHINDEKLPMIVRIDRLWSTTSTITTPESQEPITVTNYYLRGPLFLRPVDIAHEPTRLFYRNEVFKEISREITASLDQIVYSNNNTNNKKCVVMNSKKFVSSRLTEVDEADVYVCEAKYSLQLKTFRKFTKGLRKFELSLKCYEDEVYFLKRELQLKKHISPMLKTLRINYDESSADIVSVDEASGAIISNQNSEDYWAQVMHEDDASSQSFNDSNLDSSNVGSPLVSKTLKTSFMSTSMTKTPDHMNNLSVMSNGTSGKKIRVPRDKKSAYNMFSKEFRKKLRDTKSSLSFVNMSKEVGNRWRALSAKERAMYEEKARIESIKEQQRRAAEAKAAAEAAANQPQVQNISHSNVASSPHSNHINHILAVQAAQQQQHQIIGQQPNANNQMYINTNSNMMQTSTGSPIIMNKQTPILLYPNQQVQPQQQQQGVYVNQSQIAQQMVYEQPQAPPPQPLPKPVETPRQVQHKEAYIKYIANLRKQQQLYEKGSLNSVAAGVATPGDWYNSIDIRANRIKEHKVMPPPCAWIENCSSNDVLTHLLSMRYHLLSDAINIQREPLVALDENNLSANAEQEMVAEMLVE